VREVNATYKLQPVMPIRISAPMIFFSRWEKRERAALPQQLFLPEGRRERRASRALSG
jgi:hypothetical protein